MSKQKFPRGCRVLVSDEMPPEKSHFPKGFEGIVDWGAHGSDVVTAWNYQQDRIDALVEALEKTQKSNEFLKDQLSELANFNPDWDKLEASYESWREIAAELLVAKERIVELDRKNCELDSLTQRWSVERAEYADRIAELESRTVTVKLPTGYVVRPGHPINEGERGVMIPKDGGTWLSRFNVEHMLHVAGIQVIEGEG